jgi:hypothetical protein
VDVLSHESELVASNNRVAQGLRGWGSSISGLSVSWVGDALETEFSRSLELAGETVSAKRVDRGADDQRPAQGRVGNDSRIVSPHWFTSSLSSARALTPPHDSAPEGLAIGPGRERRAAERVAPSRQSPPRLVASRRRVATADALRVWIDLGLRFQRGETTAPGSGSQWILENANWS